MSLHHLLLLAGDPAVQQTLKRVLQRSDRTIEAVNDGRQALDFLRSRPCDLLIAGQGVNGSDGMKLLRRMQTLRPDTKVILTGEPSPIRALAAIRAHAYSYLHNPPAPGTLSEMVQAALDSSSWRDDLKVISARPDWVTVDVRCKMEAAERASHLAREWLVGLPAALAEDITTAFRELLMNAIEHGCRLNGRKRVRVSLLRTPASLMVHIQDPGKGFSRDSLPHAAVCNPDNSPTRHVEIRAEKGQRPGGFGILMASKLVDELLYNERGNEVFFVKNFT